MFRIFLNAGSARGSEESGSGQSRKHDVRQVQLFFFKKIDGQKLGSSRRIMGQLRRYVIDARLVYLKPAIQGIAYRRSDGSSGCKMIFENDLELEELLSKLSTIERQLVLLYLETGTFYEAMIE